MKHDDSQATLAEQRCSPFNNAIDDIRLCVQEHDFAEAAGKIRDLLADVELRGIVSFRLRRSLDRLSDWLEEVCEKNRSGVARLCESDPKSDKPHLLTRSY